jgi:hypothetical protein
MPPRSRNHGDEDGELGDQILSTERLAVFVAGIEQHLEHVDVLDRVGQSVFDLFVDPPGQLPPRGGWRGATPEGHDLRCRGEEDRSSEGTEQHSHIVIELADSFVGRRRAADGARCTRPRRVRTDRHQVDERDRSHQPMKVRDAVTADRASGERIEHHGAQMRQVPDGNPGDHGAACPCRPADWPTADWPSSESLGLHNVTRDTDLLVAAGVGG